MKKPIIVLLLLSNVPAWGVPARLRDSILPLPVIGAKTIEKASDVEPQPLRESVQPMTMLRVKEISNTKSEATPVAIAAVPAPVIKKEEQTLKTVSSLDLRDANLSKVLTSEKIMITGILPKVCADRLSLSDVKISGALKSSEDLKDTDSSSEDLKEYASTLQAQITYSSDSEDPTLCECVENAGADSEKVDLSTDPRFARTTSFHPEMMLGGLVGEPLDLKSPEYIKMEKQIKELNCKDCNTNWKVLQSHLKQAQSSPLLASIMKKILEDGLSNMDKKIDDATDLASLKALRTQIEELNSYASTDEQHALAIALFYKLTAKNDLLANSGTFKTATMATNHADFNRDTYAKMATLTGVAADQRAELKEKSNSFATGGEERLQYLSGIDGDHPEVRKYLRDSEKQQQNLVAQMRKSCMGRMNQYRFTQCGELQNEYASNQQLLGEIQSRFTLADNQNWNGIFSYWDKRNVAYDLNWKNTFTHPVQQNSPNSLPDMYDPRDKRYSNFDASKMYQTNGGVSGLNPLFTEQGYSITPIVQ